MIDTGHCCPSPTQRQHSADIYLALAMLFTAGAVYTNGWNRYVFAGCAAASTYLSIRSV